MNIPGDIKRLYPPALFAFCLCLIPNILWSDTSNLQRGRLIYENHCRVCHESMVHIRANHKAHSRGDVYREVLRWSQELKLNWRADEVTDVAEYLFLTFYVKNLKDGGNNMKLTTSAFSPNASIPTRYTCEGEDISPALSWTGQPEGTKTLVLIVDDPDAPDPAAPKMTWVHWVLYNLPGELQGLPQAVAADELPQGTLEGINDWKRTGYGGPCPPIGRHRYFFRLYALDTELPDLKQPTKTQLEQAMRGHILEQVELIGTYQK